MYKRNPQHYREIKRRLTSRAFRKMYCPSFAEARAYTRQCMQKRRTMLRKALSKKPQL